MNWETYQLPGKKARVRTSPKRLSRVLKTRCISNSLRVVKTYRQINATRIGYLDAARGVIAADGVQDLFGRGLKTRILTNGLQGYRKL